MAQSEKRNAYQTILVISLGLIGLSFLFKTEILMYIGIGIGALSIVLPFTAPYISMGWFKLGEGLGWINGRILLSVIFFIFLFPIALIYRWSRKNALYKKNLDDSLFQVKDHQISAKDLQDPW